MVVYLPTVPIYLSAEGVSASVKRSGSGVHIGRACSASGGCGLWAGTGTYDAGYVFIFSATKFSIILHELLRHNTCTV